MTVARRTEATTDGLRRLVVIPTDPIGDYEAKGLTWMTEYYNPTGLFDRVYALSPLEHDSRHAWGLDIAPSPVWRFRHDLGRLRPQVVRAYGGYWPADLAVSTRLDGVPIVVSVHDTANVHASVALADMVICMSRPVREKVLEHGTEGGRVHILPNRVDLGVFRPMPTAERLRLRLELAHRHGKHGRCILHIGRKSDEKNLDSVLKALALLPDDVWLLALGQPRTTAEYLSLASDRGVADRVVWVDSIPNSRLPEIYNAVSLVAVPSRREGFGVVFLEAVACGTPVVTSDIAPMNEYLTHGKTAWLVKDHEDPVELASAIHRLLDDERLSDALRAAAPSAAQAFSRSDVDRRERGLYEEVMRSPARTYGRAERRVAARVFREQLYLDLQRRWRRRRHQAARLLRLR
jgi:glycosyltransferase involved in cell wall biosynthesis